MTKNKKNHRRQKNKSHSKPSSSTFLRVVGIMFILFSLYFALAASFGTGAELIESYDDPSDTNFLSSTSRRGGQTFTIGTTGTDQDWILAGISANISRSGTPGLVNVSIYETNGTVPTTLIAQNTTFNADNLDTTDKWFNITIPGNIVLNKSAQYAFVFENTTAASIEYRVVDVGTYAGGSFVDNQGGDWVIPTSDDMIFEVWGFDVINITLNKPANNSQALTGTTVAFEATVNSTTDLVNSSLLINDVINLTNTITGGQNTTGWNQSFAAGDFTWSVRTCDTNFCLNGVNRAFTITDILENNESWSNLTTEGNTDFFQINVTTDGTDLVTANLVYNSTITNATFTNVGAVYTIGVNHIAPTVSSQQNFTFYWNLGLDGGSFTNTTQHNQTVNNFGLDNCSANSVLVLNYTLRDEEDQTVLDDAVTGTNTTIDLDVSISTLNGTLISTFSDRYTNISNAQVCLENNLTTEQYRLDATAFYEADAYSQEFHNIQNFTLENSSIPSNINLFDLPTSSTTQFLIIFKDASFLPVEDALIDITRNYLSEGVFKSVEVPKTDFSGQATASFDTTGAIYTIIVKKEGTILSTFENVAIFCEDAVIGDCKLNLNSQQGVGAFPDWDVHRGVTYTMTFDEPSRTVTAIFTVNDGSSKTMNLNVTKYDRLGNTSVCSDALTTSSGTLSCIVPASFGNTTVIAELSASGSPLTIIATKIFGIKQSARDTFGNDGYIFVIILLITLPMLMINNKTSMIVGIFFGLVSMAALTLYDASMLGVTSSIIWFLIAGGILIWKIKDDE